MCGRYTFTQTPDAEMVIPPEIEGQSWQASYNIAPSQYAPIIPMEDPKRIHLAKWGLLPSWAKDPKIAYKMINARGETAHEKPAFRQSFSRSRCLVLADSFYEWQKSAKGKQPYRIMLANEQPFYLAGLSAYWAHPEGYTLHTFTIITTTPNELMEPLHNRMPVILPKTQAFQWLQPTTPQASLKEMLLPFPSEEMKAYPVGAAVGNVRNNSPELIEEIKPEA